MALKPCGSCGKELGTLAKVCPHCGAQQWWQAYWGCGLVLLFAGIFFFLLRGC